MWTKKVNFIQLAQLHLLLVIASVMTVRSLSGIEMLCSVPNKFGGLVMPRFQVSCTHFTWNMP